MRIVTSWRTVAGVIRSFWFAIVLFACGSNRSEPMPEADPLPLGRYSAATIEHLSKSCRGAVSWPNADTFECHSGPKLRDGYFVWFDKSGAIVHVSFAGFDHDQITEIFERAIAPIVEPSIRTTLQRSIPTLSQSATVLAPRLLGSSSVQTMPDGSTRRLLSWGYEPAAAPREAAP
jgi:hypothetical protein